MKEYLCPEYNSYDMKLYKKISQEFSARIVKELDDNIDSIILYGSVARENANRESDIDILVISKQKGDIEKKVLDISYDLDYENNFDSVIVPIILSPEEVERDVRVGSYFIQDVLTQGIILYDNGTFKRIREKAFRAGG